MHIALVLTQSLDSPSGVGRYWPIARELTKLGHHVSIIAPHHNWTPEVAPHEVRDGVDVWCAGQMHVRKVGSRKEYFSPVQLLWVSLRGAIASARLIRYIRPDVIHLGKPQPINGLAARWVTLLNPHLPLYVDCDDYEAVSNRISGAWQRHILTYFEDSLPKRARAVTVNTRFTQHRLEAQGVPSRQIVYVPGGIDRQRLVEAMNCDQSGAWLGDPATSKRILYLGSLELVNHPIDLLLNAMTIVRQAEPHACLLVVGGGADFDRLQAHVKEHGQTGYIRFTGRVPANEVGAYYRAAHVTVDPVYNDLVAQARSPLKIVESLAVGTPVVTAEVGDRCEMLGPDHAGLLVKPGDAQALAEGLLRVLREDSLRQQLIVGTAIAREKFWWDVLVQDWVKVYSL